MKRFIALFCLAVAFCLVFSSCDEGGEGDDLRMMTLSEQNIIMQVGERLTLGVETTPASWTPDEILWYTSNPEVVDCTGGVLNALSAGTCNIKAYTADGISAPATVIVREGIGSLASVVVPDIGKTVNYRDKESGEILSSVQVNGYSYELKPTQSSSVSLTLRATVKLNCVKTYDALGEGGLTPVVLRASAIRSSDEYTFDSPILSKSGVKTGESFLLSYSFTFYSDGRTYTEFGVEIEDADEWVDCASLLNFSVKGVGNTLSTVDSRSGAIITKSVISGYSIEYYYYPPTENEQEYMYITVILNGRKTFDVDGELGTSPINLELNLYSENDIHRSKVKYTCEDVVNSGQFSVEYSFKAGIQDRVVRSFYVEVLGDKK